VGSGPIVNGVSGADDGRAGAARVASVGSVASDGSVGSVPADVDVDVDVDVAVAGPLVCVDVSSTEVVVSSDGISDVSVGAAYVGSDGAVVP